MESKLKTLKVAELKGILKKASVTGTQRLTKSELVAKITAEPAAVDAYNALYPTGVTPQHDASSGLKPNASVKQPRNPTVSPKKAQDPAPPPKSVPTTSPTTKPAAATAVEDPELEKRKARASRFGIPLVVPTSTDEKSKRQLPDDETKLKERAERLGARTAGRKRGALESTDPEELERRKKRAERFGIPLAGASKA